MSIRCQFAGTVIAVLAAMPCLADEPNLELTFDEMQVCDEFASSLSEFSGAAFIPRNMLNEQSASRVADAWTNLSGSKERLKFFLPISVSWQIVAIPFINQLQQKHSDFVQSVLGTQGASISDEDMETALEIFREGAGASIEVRRICQDAYPRRNM